MPPRDVLSFLAGDQTAGLPRLFVDQRQGGELDPEHGADLVEENARRRFAVVRPGERVRDRGNGLQVAHFPFVDRPVCFGDVEEAVEHVLENAMAAREQTRDLASIGLVARGVLLGEVEKWGINAATNVTNININVSQMTGAQLTDLLKKLPDGVTYSLNLDKETP